MKLIKKIFFSIRDGHSIFDRPPSKRQLRRQQQRMMENLRLNQENPCGDGRSIMSHYKQIPRTRTINPASLEKPNPEEFAALLTEKLEELKRSQEQYQKLVHSTKKVMEVSA